MPIDDIIRLLKMDMELTLFDASTGETIIEEQLKGRDITSHEIYLAEKEAVKLLGRNIPKKLVPLPFRMLPSGEAYLGCPSCKTVIPYEYTYCPHCGQRFKYPPDGESVG